MLANSSTTPHLPPFLRREAERQLPQIQEAVARVVRSGRFLFGDELSAFEREMAAMHGGGELRCAACGSGTEAIELALRALGVGAGGRVVTQSHSSPFTALAIWAAGARPVFVDSSADDFGIDLGALERALADGADAVIAVHLYGQPVRIREVAALAARHGVPLIEDCAQAQGAASEGQLVGTFGIAGCFSFYPTKNVGALGDGGAVITRDGELDARLRRLRNGGLVAPGVHDGRGITSRLGELQAAVLRLRLAELDAGNARRREHARAYRADLDASCLVPAVERAGSSWAPHQFVVRHRARDALLAGAERLGVPLQVHYPLPIHRQRGFELDAYPLGSLPVAERLAAEVVSLPTHPEMTDDERLTVITAVNTAAASAHGGEYR
ncbi:MAG: DegT/DnrJ/EryC1/StrS family aminotransferase [Planctomycetes bacterium]|nr:DegT/DnrJ/EryC1/StrS family aminotransferase [Planctomycetota bacterium]